jgi:hypothetical protein
VKPKTIRFTLSFHQLTKYKFIRWNLVTMCVGAKFKFPLHFCCEFLWVFWPQHHIFHIIVVDFFDTHDIIFFYQEESLFFYMVLKRVNVEKNNKNKNKSSNPIFLSENWNVSFPQQTINFTFTANYEPQHFPLSSPFSSYLRIYVVFSGHFTFLSHKNAHFVTFGCTYKATQLLLMTATSVNEEKIVHHIYKHFFFYI